MKKLVVSFFIVLFSSAAVQAANIQKQILPSSYLYLFVRAKESIRLSLAFSNYSKADILDNYASQRVNEIKYANLIGDDKNTELSLNRYRTQKAKSLQYAKNAYNEALMAKIKERTITQQREMTLAQVKLNNNELRNKIIEIQKETANQVMATTEAIEGTQASEILKNEVRAIWYTAGTSTDAPPADWVYKGGSSVIYADGTSGSSNTTGNKVNNIIEGNGGNTTNQESSRVIKGNSDRENQAEGSLSEPAKNTTSP